MDSEICQNSVILDKILNEITLEGKICNTNKGLLWEKPNIILYSAKRNAHPP